LYFPLQISSEIVETRRFLFFNLYIKNFSTKYLTKKRGGKMVLVKKFNRLGENIMTTLDKIKEIRSKLQVADKVDEVKKTGQSIEGIEAMKEAFTSGEYHEMVKTVNSYTLPKIAKDAPDELYETAKDGILKGNHNDWSLTIAVTAIKEAVTANPTLAEDAVELIKIGMAHEKSNSLILMDADDALETIGKVNPNTLLKVESAIKEGLKSDKNDGFSIGVAEDKLKDISSQRAIQSKLASKKQYQQ
jgi:hypothetical protein